VSGVLAQIAVFAHGERFIYLTYLRPVIAFFDANYLTVGC
jgi:hypothetical protein